MKVLFCTDGSKVSFNTLKNFSRFVKSDVIVDTICVIDWSFLPDDVVIEESGFTTSCRNVADTILERSLELVHEVGFTAGKLIKYCGAAVETILEQLDKDNYDIVVLGSHGKKGFQRWLGSVSREILDSTSKPVYLSKELKTKNKILFTADGSDLSDEIVHYGLKNLNLTSCEVYVCSVFENPDLLFLEGTLDSNWLLALQTQQEVYAEHALNKIKNILASEGVAVAEAKVISGIPALSIIDYIKTQGIDLVVLGSRHKTKIQNFFVDSVSKRVIEHANCDALILKEDFNN